MIFQANEGFCFLLL